MATVKLPSNPVFKTVGTVADALDREVYVVGGYVRDLLLHRHSKDIDFVTVGSGIELAQAVGKALGRGTRVNVFRNYGTAQVHGKRGEELEFVGARRESYNRDSRNPIVEDGTLDDDLARRDFTINAMAVCLNNDRYGELVDRYNGVEDLYQGIIRTPGNPDVTFSDDPLRMMRAVRFATQLGMTIHPDTLEAIRRNAGRLEIITASRIRDELEKIMASAKPSTGWQLMKDTGLLDLVLPQLKALSGVETREGRAHKDNFQHTMTVLDNVSAVTDDSVVRWAALLHDIAKPLTKRWDASTGWTFHNHNTLGARMVPEIFSRLQLPMGAFMKRVQKLVELHMRPISLVDEGVTDSAVRRLMNYAEDALDQLMILARADVTSRNNRRRQMYLENFDLVESKFKAVHDIDVDRAYRPALNGNHIMTLFHLPQSREVGQIMTALIRAGKDCEIGPTQKDALEYVIGIAATMGLQPDLKALQETFADLELQ